MDFLFGSDRHLLIWLNSNLTIAHRPLFEIIYGTEAILLFVGFICSPLLLIATWRAAPLHINIRLILVVLIVHGIVGMIARAVILYHQEFGRRSQETIDVLTVASILRDMLFANGTTVTFLIASDRFVATHHWSWYERQTRCTMSVAVILLIFSETFSVVTACSSVLRLYSLLAHYLMLCTIQSLGSVFFLLVFRHNSDLSDRYRIKFGMPNYSVARSYQIKENMVVIKGSHFLFIILLRVLYKIAITTALLAPPFILFAFYYATESIASMEFPRKTAIAIFDLSIAIFVVTFEFRLVSADDRLKRGLWSIRGFACLGHRLGRNSKIKNAKSAAENTDCYFSQLSKEWK